MLKLPSHRLVTASLGLLSLLSLVVACSGTPQPPHQLYSPVEEPYDYYELYQLLDRSSAARAEDSDEVEEEEEILEDMNSNSALDWYY